MVDSRTPVIVGVGQFTEHLGDDYRGMSAVELAAEAARAALEDCGGQGVAAAIDTVAGVRPFELSMPSPPPFGASDNYPRSVANRIGADPARAVLEKIGGQGPQHLVTEFGGAIAAGKADVVLLFGSENTSTLRYFAKQEEKPNFTEQVGGQLEDRGLGYEGIIDGYTVAHGLIGAPAQYGLMENARRARLGLSVADYRRAMAELFAPFTEVAAKNPYSSSPVRRSAEELATVTESNRMICDPYPRLLVARDQVNQGAAVLLMSVEAARRHGVPQDKWVFLHGHADAVEHKLVDRADLGASPAAVFAVETALRTAGLGLDDIATFDLYSCFPIPVFNICDGIGLATDDPRGLTLTGGLPYFGGPGNNYSMHGIAETVNEMRRRPGEFGLITANGGIMSKTSVGIYSTTPVPWRPADPEALARRVAELPTVPLAERPEGEATIETYTVRYDWNPRTGIVIGRLDDGSRFLAKTKDEDLVALLAEGEPIGARIKVWPTEKSNRAALA